MRSMAIRAKASGARPARRTVAVASRSRPSDASAATRIVDRRQVHAAHPESQAGHTASARYAKALRFLAIAQRLRAAADRPLQQPELRPGPHADPAQEAGQPAGAVPVRPRRRHQGQGQHLRDDRVDAQANGYKVGLYTSPHLVDIRERIQINGEMIPQADFARLVRLVEPIVAAMQADADATSTS